MRILVDPDHYLFCTAFNINIVPSGKPKVVRVVAALLFVPFVAAATAAPDVVWRPGGGDPIDVVTWRQLRRLVP